MTFRAIVADRILRKETFTNLGVPGGPFIGCDSSRIRPKGCMRLVLPRITGSGEDSGD